MKAATETGIEALGLADELESSVARRKLRLLHAILKPYRATIIADRLAQRLDKLTE